MQDGAIEYNSRRNMLFEDNVMKLLFLHFRCKF